jgi:hypothetical protein
MIVQRRQGNVSEQWRKDSALCAVLAYAQCRPVMAGESRAGWRTLSITLMLRS